VADELKLRDEKLLRREAYIRRERRVCWGFGLLCLFGIVITPLFDREKTMSANTINGGLLGMLCFLGYAYYCTLLIRHIESIKAYRLKDGL
jgi:hypothetical protein